jgi:hypothetical protein
MHANRFSSWQQIIHGLDAEESFVELASDAFNVSFMIGAGFGSFCTVSELAPFESTGTDDKPDCFLSRINFI